MTDFAAKVAKGERFEFGANWEKFLRVLNEDRIRLAKEQLIDMLETESLEGKSFLDIGSGSGLFSLAARCLGAKVHSFDYDPLSVSCTIEIKRRYFPTDSDWTIEQASVLDTNHLQMLGQWDIVYSWGVLHHTGAMWKALENVASLVVEGGKLYISIYNRQRVMSRVWLQVKRTYNRLPRGLRWLILYPALVRLWGARTLYDLLQGRPFHTWRNYAEHSQRGMSAWHDVVDWVGGYPFEVAKPEEILALYHAKNFKLLRIKTCGRRLGCNEFVFMRNQENRYLRSIAVGSPKILQ